MAIHVDSPGLDSQEVSTALVHLCKYRLWTHWSLSQHPCLDGDVEFITYKTLTYKVSAALLDILLIRK